jgi:hypothetical protein
VTTTIPLAILGFLLGCALAAAITYRQRWNALLRVRKTEICAERESHLVHFWADNTMLTVIQRDGAILTTTLTELYKRTMIEKTWSNPIIWADTLTSTIRYMGEADEADMDAAREHRG